MSKMSELSQTLDDLITCGETLIKTANEIRKLFTETTQEADSDTPKTARTKKTAKEKPAETATPEEPSTTSPTLKKEDVRAVLAEKSSKGFKAEIKDLLKKYGATQLKQVNPADYEALINDARLLGEPEVNDHA